MFASLAKKDLARLRSQGYAPTDEDVVNLNDLAVKMEAGAETTAANFPRVAFAGNVTLHEPTFAALAWWWQFGRDAAYTTRGKLHTLYFMLAHARLPAAFAPLTSGRAIRSAVRKWMNSVAATEDELLRAMMFAKHGETYIEPTPEELAKPDEEAAAMLDRLYAIGTLAVGMAGLSRADRDVCTQTELVALVNAAHTRGGEPVKPSTAALYMRYMAAVNAIKARGKTPEPQEAN